MTMQVCETCRFGKLGTASSVLLTCRKRSPFQIGPSGKGVWPIVMALDWCGEYQPLQPENTEHER